MMKRNKSKNKDKFVYMCNRFQFALKLMSDNQVYTFFDIVNSECQKRKLSNINCDIIETEFTEVVDDETI